LIAAFRRVNWMRRQLIFSSTCPRHHGLQHHDLRVGIIFGSLRNRPRFSVILNDLLYRYGGGSFVMCDDLCVRPNFLRWAEGGSRAATVPGGGGGNASAFGAQVTANKHSPSGARPGSMPSCSPTASKGESQHFFQVSLLPHHSSPPKDSMHRLAFSWLRITLETAA